MIDMGKESIATIRELPQLLHFDFPNKDAPLNATALFRDKSDPEGCGEPLFINHRSECKISVVLGADLAKCAGHGQYAIDLVANCEVCQSCCVFLDYSCAKSYTRLEALQPIKKGKACG